VSDVEHALPGCFEIGHRFTDRLQWLANTRFVITRMQDRLIIILCEKILAKKQSVSQ
jgi:hypothetical protein